MLMLELTHGPLHVSASPGSGKTALCLGVISRIVSEGGNVIWACREIPNAERARSILCDFDDSDFEKITIIHYSNNLPKYLNTIISLSRSLTKRDIIILDDWCGNHGRASKGEISSVCELSDVCRNTNLVITSSSYEDASGNRNKTWVSRGGSSVERSFKTVFLENHALKTGVRVIRFDETEKFLMMTQRGLVEISS